MKIFEIEKKPTKGLIALEWVVIAYLVLTLAITLFCYTKLHNPSEMIWGRMRVLAIMGAMWGIYRLIPCRLMMFIRVAVQMMLLGWWYPDTYEINRILPNLDHHFAQWEQQIFGCQPALVFHEKMPWMIWSDLMNHGYTCYYPLILVVMLCYFFKHYEEFQKTAFIVMASFMAFYLIYITVPVTGPQYYYLAVGIDEIARGSFPDVGSYFYNHQECLPIPGHEGGLFYSLVNDAHNAGERPTAAFPSSHVGVTTVMMWLALRLQRRTGMRWLLWAMTPLYILLCLSTVYILAHYAIDAIAGFFVGTAFYFLLRFVKVNP